MPSMDVLKNSPCVRSGRVRQIESMFDLEERKVNEERWSVHLPFEDIDWSIGAIVGPSGCGKSTIAKEIWKNKVVDGFDWDADRSVIDGFPEEISIKEVAEILSSVGFSSPPSWLKPFRVLSNGEKFRATLARAIVTSGDLLVFDEFTSVVDRTVAKIGSAAVSKFVRRRGTKFVAITCHYDILEWLGVDWIYEPHVDSFKTVRLRRPKINFEIHRVDKDVWRLFKKHHYLSSHLPNGKYFLGFVEGTPAAFCGVASFPHPKTPKWRISRIVVLPDFQGIGIGIRMFDAVAEFMARTGRNVFAVMSHPALMMALSRSAAWKMARSPRSKQSSRSNSSSVSFVKKNDMMRQTASFEYIGKKA